MQTLVGAAVSFEEFKVVSGVPAIAAATAQLNRRLAARGATSLMHRSVLEAGVQHKRSSCTLKCACPGSHSMVTRVYVAAEWPEVQ